MTKFYDQVRSQSHRVGLEQSLREVIADISIFMLMGIVKKNGILLIDFALQRQRGGLSALEAVREACLERFRPIIMTTLAAPGGATRLR
ncbi:MAG: hypothetical protein QOH24_1668 [Verrucomicrobiota bacterium]|jgi:multidrug efflux pump